jgi:hypothetical protein
MKITIETDKSATNVMRRAGYGLLGKDADTGEISFVKRAGGGDYPRFHTYVKKEGKIITVNLHLDQKRPSYVGSHAHNAEHENPLLEQEALLIKKSVA